MNDYEAKRQPQRGRYPERAEAPMSRALDVTKPYKVRASCGHLTIRRMREATAGILWSEDVVIDAPNGAPCPDCATVSPAS